MNDRRLIPLSEVQPAPVRWLWANRVPLGALTVLDGDPGQSKSLLTYDVAARLTTGRPMPNRDRALPSAGAVLLQAEDHLGTVRANLVAARADLKRIEVYDRSRFVDHPLVLPDDLPVIEVAVANVEARLVVIDPITVFFGAHVNVDQDVRRAMAPLVAFADRAHVAVVIVRHLNKRGGGNPIYRGAGSIAIIAQARSALLVAGDPRSEDKYQHVLAQTKANLSTAPTLAYRTVKQGDAITIEWLGPTDCTAHDLAGGGRAEQSMLLEAAYVLYSILAEGPVWAREVIRKAASAGVAKRTLDRAKLLLGVVSRKRGSGRGSRWLWELPLDDARLQPFKDREMEDLMDQLIYSDDDPPLPGDEWKRGYRGPSEGGEDEDGEDDGGGTQRHD
jgi:hypothetical protein